jgi:enoyl-CoA hydratase/carnithine racemase
MSGTWSTLRLERAGDVVVLTMDRPERLDALSEEMFRELPEALAEVGRDDTVGRSCSPALAAGSARG